MNLKHVLKIKPNSTALLCTGHATFLWLEVDTGLGPKQPARCHCHGPSFLDSVSRTSSIPLHVLGTDISGPIHSAMICCIDDGSNISAQLYSVRVDLRVARIEK